MVVIRELKWIYHALFDGSWLCRCELSQEIKKRRLRDYNERGFNGF